VGALSALLDPAALAADGSVALTLLLLALATLVSEDAACVAAGLLVARGTIGLAAGSLACFAGILTGDLLLFAAGRTLGRPLLARAPFRRWLPRERVARASAWLERRGAVVLLLSRLTPGMRLPTYFAAGLLGTRTRTFVAWLALAAALWTPALVGGASLAARGSDAALAGRPWLAPAALFAALIAVARVAPVVLTHRGRRLLVGRWRHLTRWEFWPLAVLYVPIAAYVLWLAVRHRSLTLPTAANPAIPGGGFAGESKIAILRALAAGSPDASLRATLIPGRRALAERLRAAEEFLDAARLAYPVVLKPDVAERGTGVAFARGPADLAAALAASDADLILQEHAPGLEFGIFYVRHPDEPRGRIVSITEKVLPVVCGDGRRTLEELILDDERAVCMARTHLARFAARRDEVPAAGETITLVEVGTHSRGAVFKDGAFAWTPALEEAIDVISRRYAGFHFGRYDVRAARVSDLRAGRGFKIVELNGLTAEATHVYHPGSALRDAYRVLFEQWRIAFAIGRANRARGHAPASLRELAALVRRARRSRRVRPARETVHAARHRSETKEEWPCNSTADGLL